MSNVFHWDELEILRKNAEQMFTKAEKPKQEEVEQFCDYMEFVLCMVYAYGWHDAEEVIGIVPWVDGLDDMAVNLEVAGETFRDRISADSTYEEVQRIIETESHRDYNTGVHDAAVESGNPNLMKTWETMKDDRVRDSHQYLDGVSVGIDDRFYTDDGDSAMYPGDFDNPALNINCRCFIVLTYGEMI